MPELFKNQLDYISFVYGLAFILLFAICGIINQEQKNSSLKWFGLFGLFHGTGIWFKILIISFGENYYFLIIRELIDIISFLCLFTFSYTSYFKETKTIKWLFIILSLLFITGLFNLVFMHILFIIIAILSSISLWKYEKNFHFKTGFWRIISIVTGLYGIISNIIIKDSIVELIYLFLSFIMLTSIWIFYLTVKRYKLYSSIKKPDFFSEHWLPISIILGITAGWFLTENISRYMEKKEKYNLLIQTEVAASTIDFGKVKNFHWSEEDLKNKPYLDIKDLLIKIRKANPNSRFVSLMGIRGNNLYVLADSEPPDSEDYSPPGQLYEEGAQELKDFYKQENSMIIGPVYDRWGAWISAYVHLYTPEHYENAVAIAIDYDATFWQSNIAQHRLAGIIITLLFIILLFLFFLSQQSSIALRLHSERSAYFQKALLNMTKNNKGNLMEKIKTITENMTDTLMAERVSIWKYNEEHSKIICDDLYIKDKQRHETGLFLKSSDYPVYFKTLDDLRNIVAENAENNPATCEFTENYLKPLNIKSMLDTQIFWQGKAVGLICIEHVGQQRYWTQEEQEYAISVADMLPVFFETEERLKAEEAEKQRTRELETLLDSIPGVAFFKNSDFKYVTANKTFCETVKSGKDEIAGKTDYELFPDNTAAKYREEDEMIILGKKDFVDFEEEIIHEDKKMPLAIRKVPLKNSTGTIIGLIGLGFDISERKRLESQLRQAQKMEAIGTLAGGIAHDFNNILAIIMGYTELAITKLGDNSSICSKLKESLKAIKRGKELIQQILAFSRQNDEEIKPIEITTLVKEALKFIRSSIPAIIDIKQNIIPNVTLMLGDPIHIHQILINLCSNAAHAMKRRGGLIEITLENIELKTEEEETLSLSLSRGYYFKLTVKDTGDGMEKNIMEKVFDPFFTTKAPGEGTGMGLSVVYGIVKNYNGAINVSSHVGEGTTFEVYLPRLKGKAVKEEKMLPPVRQGNESILLVDDEESLLSIEKEMLETAGYRVQVKTSSMEALKLFREKHNTIDLIVTDFAMPQMTGFEMAKEALKIKPGIPVLLCTGFNNSMTKNEVLDAGLADMMLKPFTLNELADKIREILDRKL